jgi:hypothetical protein
VPDIHRIDSRAGAQSLGAIDAPKMPINISQAARTLVFVGMFDAGGLRVVVEDGRLTILQDGRSHKFVPAAEHRTFSGESAARRGQSVLYVTERSVFALTPAGLELTEVAPGVDIGRHILGRMAFRPIVQAPRLMDQRIFRLKPMGLRDGMLEIPFDGRLPAGEAGRCTEPPPRCPAYLGHGQRGARPSARRRKRALRPVSPWRPRRLG